MRLAENEAGSSLMMDAHASGISMPRHSRPLLIPIVLFVVIVIVEVTLAWTLSNRYHPFKPMNPDTYEYQHLARNLLEYGHYGFGPNWRDDPRLAKSPFRFMYDDDGFTMFRAPGHPVLLAGLKWIGVDSRGGEQVVFALVNGATGVIVYTLARRLFGALAGIGAGVLFVLNPGAVFALTKGGREPVLGMLFTLGFLLAVIALRRRAIGLGLVAGLCFGLAGYFKVSAAAAGTLVGLVLFGIAVRHRQPALFRTAAALVMLAVVPLLPWLARNSLAVGELRLEPELTGLHLRDVLVDAHWRNSPAVVAVLDPWKANNPLEADRILKRQVRAYAREHPAAFVKAWAASAAFFWSPVGSLSTATRDGGRVGRKAPLALLDVLAVLYYVPFLALAITSFWIYRARQETWLIVAVVVLMTVLNTSQARHRIPFEPVLIVFAAGTIAAAYGRWLAGTKTPTYTRGGS